MTNTPVRRLRTHQVTGLNEAIEITAVDPPGPGGAHHHYVIEVARTDGNELGNYVDQQDIKFQKGPIVEKGINGISNEALLASVVDRLEGFQSGTFRCRENALALTKIEEAMMWLHARTRDRMERGVEGKSEK